MNWPCHCLAQSGSLAFPLALEQVKTVHHSGVSSMPSGMIMSSF